MGLDITSLAGSIMDQKRWNRARSGDENAAHLSSPLLWLKAILYAKIGGQKKCIMGDVEVINIRKNLDLPKLQGNVGSWARK